MTTVIDDAAVLEAFGVCIVAYMVIVALHVVGLHATVRIFRHNFHPQDIAKLRYHQTVILILAAMMVLFGLHLLTNFAWGGFIYGAGVLPSVRDGVFYSLENYTSLGLTRVNVGDTWRMLAPMISLSGVFCLAWSTAMLVSFLGQIYSLRLGE